MIKANDIVERYYVYYERISTNLNFSPIYNVGLRNNCYLIHSMRDTYSMYPSTHATTSVKRI